MSQSINIDPGNFRGWRIGETTKNQWFSGSNYINLPEGMTYFTQQKSEFTKKSESRLATRYDNILEITQVPGDSWNSPIWPDPRVSGRSPRKTSSQATLPSRSFPAPAPNAADAVARASGATPVAVRGWYPAWSTFTVCELENGHRNSRST